MLPRKSIVNYATLGLKPREDQIKAPLGAGSLTNERQVLTEASYVPGST